MSRRATKSPVGNLVDMVEYRPADKKLKPLITPKSVSFKTKKQLTYYEAILCNKITVSSGAAGTGKTFVAVYAACCELAAGNVDKIVITKPAVEIGNTMGYLPGDMDEKMAPFIRSIEDCFTSIIGDHGLANLYMKKKLEILPLNFMRGLTLENCIVICDEAQNADYGQVKSLLTRLGEDCKLIINGDLDQTDLGSGSGLPVAIHILKNVNDTDHVVFTIDDIVRSGIVREILIGYHEFESDKHKKKEANDK